MDNTYASSIFTVINRVNKVRSAKGQALLPRFNTHTFRHTFATRCFEAGISPKTVQAYLGHTNLNMTMDTYTSVLDTKKADDMKLLEATMSSINSSKSFSKCS